MVWKYPMKSAVCARTVDAATRQLPERRVTTHHLCFCSTSHGHEENVWKLCEYVKTNHPSDLNKCFAVFISNEKKQIPIWYQRNSKREDRLVIWVLGYNEIKSECDTSETSALEHSMQDYHVLLIYKDTKSWVYDLDTELPFPCSLDKYMAHAIRDDRLLKQEFWRLFRVVSGEEYLNVFASDRSHMLKEDGTWLAEPPAYPCIHTPYCQNNLSEFISMEKNKEVGTVLTSSQLLQMFF